MTWRLVDSTQQEMRRQRLDLTSVTSSNAKYVGRVKLLEAVVDDVIGDLYAPALGIYNKALISSLGCLSGGPSESLVLRSQFDYLATQVKNLTGADLGDGFVDVRNDLAITSLKASPTTSQSRQVWEERLCALTNTRFDRQMR